MHSLSPISMHKWPQTVNWQISISKSIIQSESRVIEKYTARMVSEIFLIFNCQLRRFENKSLCYPPTKDMFTQRVYSYFKLNSFRLMCYHYIQHANLISKHLSWQSTWYSHVGVVHGSIDIVVVLPMPRARHLCWCSRVQSRVAPVCV